MTLPISVASPAMLATALSKGMPSLVTVDQMRYVLITPARNEEQFIGGTLQSMISQTIRPRRWIIVSDGSTDRTDEIVASYAVEHDWIQLLRMPDRHDRQFAAKAHAFNAGFAALKELEFDLVGNLDADLTFDSEYFAFLISKFVENPTLGVAGTPFVENESEVNNHTYSHKHAQLEHVSGACQLFRRKCFEEVGGYVPVKGGAIDWIAVTTARMKGWETRTFPEKHTFHHRKIGTGTHSPLMVRFQYGRKAYYVGGHPLWVLLRSLTQGKQRPFILGGIMFLAGYVWAFVTRTPRAVSPELMAFYRSEQMSRLKAILGSR
jgi:biofilm PGA synthesis N-glycosyltransferase PgaC